MKSNKAFDAELHKIDPIYSHRVSMMELERAYGSPREAFDRGDYLWAIELSEEGTELKGCACVLAGLLDAGVKILESLQGKSDIGNIYLAYGLWCLERNEDAKEILLKISHGTHLALAQGLLGLVESSEINVFVVAAHVPIFTEASGVLRQPSYRAGQFHIKHVCTQLPINKHDCVISEPFDEFIESLPIKDRPKFIYLGTPEWFLPRGIERVCIPKILWVHDTDFHMYRSYENYLKPDLLLACGSQEHYELTRGLGVRCATNLFSDIFSLMPDAPPEDITEKSIDVLFTGAAVNTPNYEKSRFMFQLSKLSDNFKIMIVDGHLDHSKYRDLLARAKFLPIVNRYRGQPSPRWRDALSEGTLVLSPQGVPYDEICEGFFAYNENTIAEDIRRHLVGYAANSPDSPYYISNIVNALRKRFLNKKTSLMQPLERNLKFCALMALEFEQNRQVRATPTLPERWCWLVPQIDSYIFGAENILAKIDSLAKALDIKSFTIDSQYIDLASLYIQRIIISGDQLPEKEQILKNALSIIDQGLVAHPKSLLLRFNRAHWNFFYNQTAKKETAILFADLLAQIDQLEFNPLGADIGLGYAGLSSDPVLPYYEYGQLIVSMTTASGTPYTLPDHDIRNLKAFLAGCAHGYIGLIHAGNDEHAQAQHSFRAALEVYPGNHRIVRLLLDSLITRADGNGCLDDNLCRESIRLFYGLANHDPGILLTDTTFDIMEILSRCGMVEQLTSLLDDWYWFARVVVKAKPRPLEEEISGLSRLFKYKSHFPAHLTEIIASWSQMDLVPEFECILDSKLFVAMHYSNSQNFLIASHEELKNLKAKHEEEMARYKYESARLLANLEEIHRSKSWRITKPLRFLSGLLRKGESVQ